MMTVVQFDGGCRRELSSKSFDINHLSVSSGQHPCLRLRPHLNATDTTTHVQHDSPRQRKSVPSRNSQDTSLR